MVTFAHAPPDLVFLHVGGAGSGRHAACDSLSDLFWARAAGGRGDGVGGLGGVLALVVVA